MKIENKNVIVLVLFLSAIIMAIIIPSAQGIVLVDEYNADETFNAGGAYLEETWYAIKYVPSKTCVLQRVEFMTGGAPGGTWYMYLLETDPYVLTGEWPGKLDFVPDTFLAGCTFIQEGYDYGWNGADFHEPVQVQAGTTYWIAFFPARESYPAIADPSSTTAVDYTFIVGIMILPDLPVSWGLKWWNGGYESSGGLLEAPWMMKFYTLPGIPGFPYEAILLGVVSVIFVLWSIQRRR